MRVVVDTNVFVSAALKDKSFPALALQIVEQRYTLLKSPATESQLVEVIARPRIAALIDPASVEWIRIRTGEGRMGSVARGQNMGRPPKLTSHQKREAIQRRGQGKEWVSESSGSYNICGAAISRLMA